MGWPSETLLLYARSKGSLSQYSEPTTRVAPTSALSEVELSRVTGKLGIPVALKCNAGGFPVPMFRSRSLGNVWQWQRNLVHHGYVPHSGLKFVEPTGRVAPTSSLSEVKLSQVKGNSGSALALKCLAGGFPVPSFRWFHVADGGKKRPVTLNDRVIQVGGTLIIKQATVEDSGKYLCVVNNSVGGESVETVLTVTAPLTASIDPREQTVEFGRSSSMTCVTGGNPINSVTWYKDGSKLSHDGETLTISSVKKEDRGMYQCFVRNDQESAQGTGELKLGGRFDPPVLTSTFSEMTKQPGSDRDAFLKCSATGNPRPDIAWELDGKVLTNTDRRQINQQVSSFGEVVSHLNITALHAHDGGFYRCIASSKVGEVSHATKLNVFGLPFVRPMDPKKVVAGENLIVHCPVAGYPIHSITWERNGRILPINRRQKVYPNGTLIIEEVERNADQGTYHCVAKNTQGYTAKGDLQISVMVPPVIGPFEFDGPLLPGDGGQLSCYVAKGDVPLTISWNFHGKSVEKSPNISTQKVGTRTSLLTLENVHFEHSGTYTCVAKNDAGTAQHSADLTVNVPPVITPFSFGPEALFSGESSQITCFVGQGDLPLNIRWAFHGKAVSSHMGITTTRVGGRASMLVIDHVIAGHSGNYTCTAENQVGLTNFTARLVVNGNGIGIPDRSVSSALLPPIIEPFSFGSGPMNSGKTASVQCLVSEGDLPLKITWAFHGREMSSQMGITTMMVGPSMSLLMIQHVIAGHSGNYTCTARNLAGIANYTAGLLVNVPPVIEPFDFGAGPLNSGRTASVHCLVSDGDLPLSITWAFHGRNVSSQMGITTSKLGSRMSVLMIEHIVAGHSGRYTCTARNSAGVADRSAELVVNVPPLIKPFEFGPGPLNAGETASVQCLVEGDLPLVITWAFHGRNVSTQLGITTSKIGARMSVLMIDHIIAGHSGRYTCTARNPAGTADVSADLLVNVPPIIKDFEFGPGPLNAGETTSVQCLVSEGDLPLTITWAFHGRNVSSQMGISTSKFGSRMSVLMIEHIVAGHSGKYTCTARNSVGTADYSAHLLVNVPPTIAPFSFGDAPLSAGAFVTLQCTVTYGDEPLSISWTFHGHNLSSQMGVATTKIGNKVSLLTIDHIIAGHSGNYTCTARNSAGSDNRTALLLINVPPEIVPFEIGEEAREEGGVAQVTCVVRRGDEPLTITWSFHGRNIASNMGISTMKVGSRTSLLSIDKITAAHSGVYTCTARNEVGEHKFSAQLQVQVPPKVAGFGFGEAARREGGVAQVSCLVEEGDAPLTILWTFHGQRINGSAAGVSTHKIGEKTSILTIEKVFASHSGTYTCSARNSAGENSQSADLVVNVPPRIVDFLFGDEAKEEGGVAQVSCIVRDGDAPLTISWSFHGQNIESTNTGISTLKVGARTSILSIERVSAAHSGVYTCTARNAAGKDKFSAVLEVSGLSDKFPTILVPPKDCLMYHQQWHPYHRLKTAVPPKIDIGLDSLDFTPLKCFVPPKIVEFVFGEEARKEGAVAQVNCIVNDGDLPLTISWSFHGQNIESTHMGISTLKIGARTSILSIERVTAAHSGVYTCSARNSAGEQKFSAELQVSVPPQIVDFVFGDEAKREGGVAQVNCIVKEGDLPLTIAWSFHGQNIESTHMGINTVKVGVRTSILSIDKVAAAHSGVYTCVARNAAGEDKFSAILEVSGYWPISEIFSESIFPLDCFLVP
ncbi:unnamed protein product [Notodromas monacha]|uniref:Ig-like domain-containing protein n=1 Tax=Notodromas monacha TaxID=399045 RepID=A0A7R9G967_9CRUS|nr:unnamed protein product [Notodromas monacha]CAG0912292.1 unnamed protein product [Notodromas monacha]